MMKGYTKLSRTSPTPIMVIEMLMIFGVSTSLTYRKKTGPFMPLMKLKKSTMETITETWS